MSLVNYYTALPNEQWKVGANYSIPQSDYLKNEVGMFMHIQQDDIVNYGLYDIESYYLENFDWDALAAQVASLGYIDYIIFRAKIERGFCHWPTQVQFNNGVPFTYNGVTVPQYGFDYNISNSYISGLGVTSDTIDRFMSAFAAVGIKTGLDYPIGRDHNVRTIMTDDELRNSSDPAIYGKFDEFHEYCKAHILELIDLYDPYIIWVDNETKHPLLNNSGVDVRWENYQDIYDAVKTKKQEIIFMGNLNIRDYGGSLYADGKIQYFPQDVISQEGGGDNPAECPDDEYPDDMVHDGDPYKVPKERLWDGLFGDDKDVQYIWWDPNTPNIGITNPNQIKTQQDFQDAYDRGISLEATSNFNIGPKPASIGVGKHLIDSVYLDRLQNIIT